MDKSCDNLLQYSKKSHHTTDKKLFNIGRTSVVKPFYLPYPGFLEIGLMGQCDIGQSGVCQSSGIQCSQNGVDIREPNMNSVLYKRIIDESKGKTLQVVLSGRGDPDRHLDFSWILKYTRDSGIIPSFVTSGFHINEETARLASEYCASVGISFHNQFYTYRAIKLLVKCGVRINLFYVVSNASIDDAIKRLENNGFPEGINAVVFLMHKPAGMGSRYNVLDIDDTRVRRFFHLVSCYSLSYKIALDACSIPGIINLAHDFNCSNLESCEGGRWCAYISSDMKMMPCSFCIDCESWSYDIRNDTIENAWVSEPFARFRSILAERCPDCVYRNICHGGCPVFPEIVLCKREEREYGLN
jgi:radical SAM additional 4Fe4S-binding domain